MSQADLRRDLISRATRRAFRELAVSIVVRDIHGMWQDEGFPPADPSPNENGERRSLYQGYLDAVDWSDLGQVARAVRVFELTAKGFEPQFQQSAYDLIRRDGFQVLDSGRIVGGPTAVVREGALANLADPAAVREHLDRISRAIESDDPAQAIGSAKELIESTAKLVLRELGRSADDARDLPKLAMEAQLALKVHPSTAAPGPDGSDAVKRILGGVTTVATGVAELRNKAGTGHGPGSPRAGLGVRHAHLAVGAARLWCEFMLDTLGDPAAPWRKSQP
ncbi:MAG: hypothetical protein QG597_1012 [Actinomycetota bacterium]|nr:hypothetical protein [Actinomycetota bacterium]